MLLLPRAAEREGDPRSRPTGAGRTIANYYPNSKELEWIHLWLNLLRKAPRLTSKAHVHWANKHTGKYVISEAKTNTNTKQSHYSTNTSLPHERVRKEREKGQRENKVRKSSRATCVHTATTATKLME